MPGSEPKSKPLVESGGGNGRSTPVNVEPPSVEYMARIGRRWISLDPAITFFFFAGLIAIDVSLCEPHSWLASTFEPYAIWPRLPVFDEQAIGSWPETAKYLPYHDAPS